MRMPDDSELNRMLAELREALDQLEEGAVIEVYDDAGRRVGTRRTPNLGHLFLLMAAARRDGWRTMSGGSPASTDADGEPLPPHSDRTGEVAADPVKVHDPIRVHAERLFQYLAHALGDMRRARGSMIAAFGDVKPAEGDPACQSHARIGVFVKAERGNRCMWCYRFALANKVTPPIEILRAKDDGRRITVQMVEAALRPPPKVPRKRVVV